MTQPPTSGPHTDACIQDAARFGFCDHTRLYAPQALVRAALRDDRARRAAARRADRLSWVSLVVLVALFVALTRVIDPFLAVGFTCGFGLAWLGIYSWGLPHVLTDTAPWLPDDARERLDIHPDLRRPPRPPTDPRTPRTPPRGPRT